MPDHNKCQQVLNYTFKDISLLELAFMHSSAAATRTESNERMEFLGDVVLGLVICEQLYRDNPEFLEGQLTQVKSAVVSRQVCAEVARELKLDQMLTLGRGFSRDNLPQSLAAAVLESVVGAIYLDGGLEPAREFILRHMTGKMEAIIAHERNRNFKSMLQQHFQKQWAVTPEYELLDEKGPDHARAFEVCVQCNGQRFVSAWANSKKQAEQLAAKAALLQLGILDDNSDENLCEESE